MLFFPYDLGSGVEDTSSSSYHIAHTHISSSHVLRVECLLHLNAFFLSLHYPLERLPSTSRMTFSLRCCMYTSHWICLMPSSSTTMKEGKKAKTVLSFVVAASFPRERVLFQ